MAAASLTPNSPSTMDGDNLNVIKEELSLANMRVALNKMGVKLWKPPYCEEEKKAPVESELHELAVKLRSDLKMEHPLLFHGLGILQQNALTKLEMKKKWKETGLAHLRIKCGRGVKSKSKFLEISLKSKGIDLKKILSGKVGVRLEKLGVVSGGRVVKGREALDQQGVKNMDTLVVVDIGDGDDEDQEALGKRKLEEETTWMDEYEKSGKMPEYPKEENKYFVNAMELYKKGKIALKNNNYGEALMHLVGGHEEFTKCSDEILNLEEEFSFLNIDIAWCYLNHKVIGDFLDAENRLEDGENKLKEKYDIHSDSGKEEFLLRLHLLRGIVASHRGKTCQAKRFLKQAQMDLSVLKIDLRNVDEIVAMGYTPDEAKHGLRAGEGDVAQAVQNILAIRKRKEEEADRRKLRQRMGRCKNGSWVNLGYYKTLVKMGYTSGVAAVALKETNNNMSLAVQMMQEEPDYVDMLVSQGRKEQVTDEMVDSIAALGFEKDVARETIEEHGLDKAVEILMEEKGLEKSRKMRRVEGNIGDEVDKETKTREHRVFNAELAEEELFLDAYLQLVD